MASKQPRIAAYDAETDPFLFGRIPQPFIWGYWDGVEFRTFEKTEDFFRFLVTQEVICYAHNGGKYDLMYLLEFLPIIGPLIGIKEFRVQIINSRVVSMQLGKCKLLDSYAAVPESQEKAIGKFKIDIGKMEKSVRHLHMDDIIQRLKTDCVDLVTLMTNFRRIAGTKPTIASNAYAFGKKLGIDPGKTNHRYDKHFRKYFYGGRTECFQPGEHNNLTVLDIKSAYPYAMMHDHATGGGAEWLITDNLGNLTREEIQRAFITLECDAKGCFPFRTPHGLTFPHARNTYLVSGWEYIAAKDLGLISNEKIIEVCSSAKTINFREYVLHWFKYKNDWSMTDADGKRLHPVEYTIGKIMLNSFYGKLSQNPANYFDYKIVPRGTDICHNVEPIPNDDKYCKHCGNKCLDHGWKWHTGIGDYELHARESLWKYQYRLGDDWEGAPIYNNVATGSSITGFTRAHLLRAMHAIGIQHVIYTDTDSITAFDHANFSALDMSGELGSWAMENKNCPVGHFAGKKLYAIQLPSGKYKTATKGVRLKPEDIIRASKGETIQWRNEAPSFSILTGKLPFLENSIDKIFITRNIKRTLRNHAGALIEEHTDG